MGKTSDAAYKVQPQSPLQAGTWTDAFQQGLLFEFYVNALLFHIVSWHHWCVCLQIFSKFGMLWCSPRCTTPFSRARVVFRGAPLVFGVIWLGCATGRIHAGRRACSNVLSSATWLDKQRKLQVEVWFPFLFDSTKRKSPTFSLPGSVNDMSD